MAFRNLRANIAVRTILIAVNAYAFFFLLFEARYPLTLALTGALSLVQCWLLIASVEKANGVLTHFFRSIRSADFTQSYSFPEGAPYGGLKAEYEAAMELLRNYNLDREKNYQYIRTIAGSISVGILVFDQGGTVDLCNEAFKAMLGIREPRKVWELEGVDKELYRLFRELKNGERESVRISFEQDWLQLIVSVNDFVLLRGKYRLVTLQNIRRELEENEIDAWQKMARVLTHEIMNSITPISSLASTAGSILAKLFEEGDPTFPAAAVAAADARRDALAALHSIERRSRSLLYFVESYREFLRVPKPCLGIVLCKDLLSRIKALVGGIPAAKRIGLRLSVLPPDLGLLADNALLEQVLINLVKNSIEALEGTRKPAMEISAYLDARRRAVIEVADNGRGIEAEFLDKVFIPFFTTKKEGSGIGLSLCRQIMRLHNGSISVASAPGERTVFYLKF
jgi:two-component system, NtrC family, nitrogen regulation sensor histidine kinase NtrY